MPTKHSKSLGRTLDARPDRLDLRDRLYTPPVATLPPTCPSDAEIKKWLPGYVRNNLILNQGAEGACTGFGLACVIHYLLWRRQMTLGGSRTVERVSTRMLYHLARFYDEWPGEDYEGSSCRGALKAWHRHGVCTEVLWPYLNKQGKLEFVPPGSGWDRDAMQRRLGVYYRINRESVVDMQAAIQEIGAIYVSADVHDGWHFPLSRKTSAVTGHASLPVIGPMKNPDSMGGHAFALIGYNPTGFVVQNSWGPGWGRQGFAVLPYEDWVRNGSDAWACALGVPGDVGVSSSVITPGSSAAPRMAGLAGAAGPAASGRPALPAVSKAVQPWTLDEAYQHTVVMGNEGRPINRIVTSRDGAAAVTDLVVAAPRQWFAKQRGTRRLMVYAHGGLNSEEESLHRIRVLAPYFAANGIYPLFLTWRTGSLETLGSILEDQLTALPKPVSRFGDLFESVAARAREVFDRTIEVAARPVVKPIWGQMKQNAEASAVEERSSALVVQGLAELAAAVDGLEIHLVGHSAGSILLGHLLAVAGKQPVPVRSCSLYAPACTIDFACTHYIEAVDKGVFRKEDLHVHLLSDAREQADSVGPYGKSLLYLVSRALERAHKTPLLGLANAFDTSAAAIDAWADEEQATLRKWQRWWGRRSRNLYVLDAAQVSTGPKGRRIPANHGCFDNDADTMTRTLTRILGGRPKHAIEALEF